MQSYLKQQLLQRQQNALYRTRKTHDSAQTTQLLIDGKAYLNFCSNDYLGLASHSELKTTLQQAVEHYGVGSGASHLVTGHSAAHEALESDFAKFMGTERALLFSTGYMANLGVISALLGRQDAIFLDKLNHASLVDAAILSRAKLHRYAHNNIAQLTTSLAKSNAVHKLIATDGVFSMDGDIADLPKLAQLAKQSESWLMLDDAHGIGVLGQAGRGSIEYFNLSSDDVPIIVGTLGKAFGIFGAFVAGSELLIETLIQLARSYIYTTALPPALAVTLGKSLEIIQRDNWRREKLQQHIAYFKAEAEKRGILLMPSITPIQPIVLKDSQLALNASQALYQQGILVTAIRPPTVPQNSARLRITLSAQHEIQDIDKLLLALSEMSLMN
ncbi:8-amino-7-oxononanoate synthase [Candidatus Albibeggiatoa sp. nov. BB20]|uniref:8-amino-7-oxononanoate synthase n=1 Tax=Candidatus Albibeggiatoa sp. nov. BB20 TaxID=3162723 RepID=UPI0033658D79